MSSDDSGSDEGERLSIAAEDVEVPADESAPTDGPDRLVVDLAPADEVNETDVGAEPQPERQPTPSALTLAREGWGRAVVAAGAVLCLLMVAGVAIGAVAAIALAGDVSAVGSGLAATVAGSGASVQAQLDGGLRLWLASLTLTPVAALAAGAWIAARRGPGDHPLQGVAHVVRLASLISLALVVIARLLQTDGDGNGTATSLAWVAVGSAAIVGVSGGLSLFGRDLRAVGGGLQGEQRRWLAPAWAGVRAAVTMVAIMAFVGVGAAAWLVPSDERSTVVTVGTAFAPNVGGLATHVAFGIPVTIEGTDASGGFDLALRDLGFEPGPLDGDSPLFLLVTLVPLAVLTLGSYRCLRRQAPATSFAATSVALRFVLGFTVATSVILAVAPITTGLADPAGSSGVLIITTQPIIAWGAALAWSVGTSAVALLWFIRRTGIGEAPDRLTVLSPGGPA